MNNPKMFKALGLVSVKPNTRFARKFTTAMQYFSKETGLQICTANEEASNGWHLCVWHAARMPSVNDMRLIKEALIPDNVTLGIPLGRPAEMHGGATFMVHANELHRMNS